MFWHAVGSNDYISLKIFHFCFVYLGHIDFCNIMEKGFSSSFSISTYDRKEKVNIFSHLVSLGHNREVQFIHDDQDHG